MTWEYTNLPICDLNLQLCNSDSVKLSLSLTFVKLRRALVASVDKS